MTSSVVLDLSVVEACEVLYCPAGVKSRLPSGAKVSRRKNEVNVSLAYRFALRTERPTYGLGDAEGITAGRGIGAGEAERRIDAAGDELPMEERRLCTDPGGGGFIGRAKEAGVPGADGAGEADA